MKKIRLKRIEMENFKCFQSQSVTFCESTIISGANGTGKTTIYDSLLWTLFGTNHSGDSASDIRPHDEEGNPIHDVVISVSCTFDVDGREICITKSQAEKWTKKRGTDVTTFTGNENSFSVNGIPKTNAEYSRYIEENFCDEKTFIACTNAQTFFQKNQKEKRAMLISIASNVTDETVISSDSEFEQLRNSLVDGTVDQLIKRSKDTSKRLEKERSDIPPRIDELRKLIEEIDVSTVESKEATLSKKLHEIQTAIDELSVSDKDFAKRLDEIKVRASEIKDRREREYREAKEIHHKNLTALTTSTGGITYSVKASAEHLSEAIESIKEWEEEIVSLKKQQIEAQSVQFDADSLICPACGRPYSDERQTEIKSNFRKLKGDRMAKADVKIRDLEVKIEKAKEKLPELEEKSKAASMRLKELKESVAKVEAEAPEAVDLSKDQEYVALSKEYQSILNDWKSGKEERQERINSLFEEKAQISSELKEVRRQLSIPDRNAETEKRISELQKRQKEISQLIANEVKMVDLLERFNRVKMQMLSEEVNKNFRIVKWKLFSELINGGYQDVCQAIVNGSNYDTCLNTGHRILADIDVLETFQKMNGLDAFIFVDNAEALNDFNVPKIDRQLILLKVSGDKRLEVSNG